MAADLQGVVTKVKKHVPIGVKRRVRRAVPARYRRLWDPDWHRGTVRGTKAHWDDLGKLQLSYLKEQGLQPEHYLLDVGCGPLRAGVHFIGYLAPGHYAGIDKRGDNLEQARKKELPRYKLEAKNPHLLVNGAFEFSKLGMTFDYAIAQSVFTHLPLNNIIRCLVEMAKVLNPHGRVLISVPFGRREERGWMFQYDADSWEELIQNSPFTVREQETYRLGAEGWERVKDPRSMQLLSYGDESPAARGVLCAALTLG